MASSKNIRDFEIQVIDDPGSLDALGDALREFDRKLMPETPYLTTDFLVPWLVYASSLANIHTVLLWKNKQVVAMLPLISDKVKRGPFTIPRLGFPTQVGGHPPSFDFRYEEKDAALAAEALLSVFSESGLHWKVLSLRHLSGNSAMLGILPDMCRARGLAYSWFPTRRESYLVLDEDWDSYLARLGTRIRQQMNRGLRRVQESDGWEFVHEWPDTDSVEELLERYLAVIKGSWKSYQADDKAFVALLEDVMRSFARRGDLLLSWLRGPGADGAGNIQLRRSGVLTSFHIAYMEGCPIAGAGTLLKGSAISYAYEAGLAIYDFSTYAGHIHRWSTKYRNTANVYITKKTPAGRLIQRQMAKREANLEPE